MSFDRQSYDRKYYKANKDKRTKQRKERQSIIRQWFLDHKDTLKCKICGEDRFPTLHFHHRNPKEKEGNVSDMALRGHSIARIEKEIAKCDVLCANCHAIMEFHIRFMNKAQS